MPAGTRKAWTCSPTAFLDQTTSMLPAKVPGRIRDRQTRCSRTPDSPAATGRRLVLFRRWTVALPSHVTSRTPPTTLRPLTTQPEGDAQLAGEVGAGKIEVEDGVAGRLVDAVVARIPGQAAAGRGRLLYEGGGPVNGLVELVEVDPVERALRAAPEQDPLVRRQHDLRPPRAGCGDRVSDRRLDRRDDSARARIEEERRPACPWCSPTPPKRDRS